jgi:hypothetical protein
MHGAVLPRKTRASVFESQLHFLISLSFGEQHRLFHTGKSFGGGAMVKD